MRHEPPIPSAPRRPVRQANSYRRLRRLARPRHATLWLTVRHQRRSPGPHHRNAAPLHTRHGTSLRHQHLAHRSSRRNLPEAILDPRFPRCALRAVRDLYRAAGSGQKCTMWATMEPAMVWTLPAGRRRPILLSIRATKLHHQSILNLGDVRAVLGRRENKLLLIVLYVCGVK